MTLSNLALALWLAAAPPAPESAKEFVARVYAPYLRGESGWFVRAKEPAIRKIFTPGVADAIWKQFEEAAARREVPLLNGDPLVNAQEWKISNIASDVRLDSPDLAFATVSISNDDGPRLVMLTLRQAAEGWRIAEVEFESGHRLSELLAGRPEGRNGGARSLVGKQHPDRPPPEWEGPGWSSMSLDGGLGLTVWSGKARGAAFIDRQVGDGVNPRWLALAAIEVDVPAGTYLYPLCRSPGAKDGKHEDGFWVVALLRPTGRCDDINEGIKTNMLRAWKVDLMKKRFVPIPVHNLTCNMNCDQ